MSSSPRQLRVASVQFESAPGDKEANFLKVEAFTAAAAAQGVAESQLALASLNARGK